MTRKAKKKELEIKFIRLRNGDDMIGEITKKTARNYEIKNPMTILTDVDIDSQRQTMIMYPWLPQGIVTGFKANIDKDDVLTIQDIDAEIMDYYIGLCMKSIGTKTIPLTSDTLKASELLQEGEKKILLFNAKRKDKENVSSQPL